MMGGRHFESETPHFFKIVLSDALQNGRLGIPKKFVRKYGSNLSNLVFLQVASGDVWEVELLRGNDGSFLRRGWPEFVKHFAIKQGHFLVFRYEGGSTFRVVIFDKSASEIVYPVISENDDPRMEEDEGDTLAQVFKDHSHQSRRNQRRELPSSTLLSSSSKKKKKTNERLNKQAVGGGGSYSVSDVSAGLKSGYWRRYHPFRGSEQSEALERATSFLSPNPFFLAFMQPSFIHHSLSAPARFFMKYIPNLRSGGDINLYMSNERFWSVRYKFGIYSGRPQIKVNRGWKHFVQDNNLKLGDVCVFEMTRKVDQVSFRVVIFRANQDAVEFEEASQHKLKTSSSERDESEHGQAKNEEPASHDQSAGKSFEVEPAMQMYALPEARGDGKEEGTGGMVSPSEFTGRLCQEVLRA
ncbi:hypothetical protein NL676_023002 [Syzygium grande]|nr:hypothetical protein NL676_023002 [Syzygium grande]